MTHPNARLCLLVGLLLCLPLSASAQNRLFASRESGFQFNLARNFSTYDKTVGVFAGASLGGRISANLGLENRNERKDVLGSLEVALLRRGNFGLEVGVARRWRPENRTDWNLQTLRIFQRISLGRGVLLIPNALLIRYPAWDHDNERGYLGLDLVLHPGFRVGLEWDVVEDFRYHPLTVRVGLIKVLR